MLYLIVFLVAWIGLAVLGVRKRLSLILAIGGSFIASLVLLASLASIFDPKDAPISEESTAVDSSGAVHSSSTIDPALKAKADAGDIEAQYEIGNALLDATDFDMDEVVKWWRRSADNGYWVAQLRLGNHYCDAKEHDLAWRYTLMAAEQGSIDGISNLGFMQWGQTGMQENKREALKWYLVGEILGKTSYQKKSYNVKTIKENMTPSDIVFAEEEARNWIRDHPNITLR